MQFGIIGLGVMGRNLALNLRDQAVEVFCTDPWEEARLWSPQGITVAANLSALVAKMEGPRVILLMVKAGDPVDQVITGLSSDLSPGDIVIDGGNSHYRDSMRRARSLQEQGITFLGAGISGGSEGARKGAAIMVGGTEEACNMARSTLTLLAARASDGHPCINRFGAAGAGHFVKMVHNGIEYAIMQAIAECHGLLRHLGGHSAKEIAELFDGWNQRGGAGGFLLKISAEIIATADPLGEGDLLDKIGDAAGQKGTGSWTVEAGLEQGVPLPSIMAAVTARQISGETALRQSFQQSAAVSASRAEIDPADLESALIASMASALSQGLQLYDRAARSQGWDSDLAKVLRVWRAGSILQMGLLDRLADALDSSEAVPALLALPPLQSRITKALPAWRRVVAAASLSGCPAPVLAAGLDYVTSLGCQSLPTALVQGQRDRFGAHGFMRLDREGVHHGPWHNEDPEVLS